MNRYYPIYLDLKGKPCVVVGGGAVAQRKARSLLASGASVRVICPAASAGLTTLFEKGKIDWVQRHYRRGDLNGAYLAFAATDNTNTNERVAYEARERGIPVNVVDSPAACDFLVPSTVKRRDLVISISTGGTAPAVAKHMRKRLNQLLPPEIGQYLKVLQRWRRIVTGDPTLSPQKKKAIMAKLIATCPPQEVRRDSSFEDMGKAARKLMGISKGNA
jgi:siroheme synthase-like protein